MKVCKVVINSVSHDARVLKEAEAVRELGFDVVIIGIQDANNSIPIQILDNGVVIRRVAWQAEAFRPFFSEVIGKILLAVVAVLLAVQFGGSLLSAQWPSLASIQEQLTLDLLLETLLGVAVFSLLSFVVYRLSTEYLRKQKSHLALKKREEDELLKYEKVFSTYRAWERRPKADASGAVTTASEPSDVFPFAPSGAFHSDSAAAHKSLSEETDKKAARLVARLPRPLMRGWRKGLAPDQMRRWKVIFARERCIRKMLEEEQPAIVHAHDLTALPVGVQYAEKAGVKLIFDAHEIYDHLAQAEDDMAELNSLLLNKYAPSVDRFITINDSIARYYRKNYPSLPPALVIKNAAKPAEPVAYDGRLHDAAGLPRDRRIVIYQGGYAAKRGLIQLLMSAEYLNPNWSLVYMGWGRLEDELLRVADALKLKNATLAEKIRFVPKVKQDELPYWTAGATIGAIPYENTGLNHWFCNPNKLWEYPNAGVPIIASPFPEMSAIINTYELGWYLPDPLNPKAIADVINDLTDEQLASASQNCRNFMESDNWEVYAKRLKTLYGEMR